MVTHSPDGKKDPSDASAKVKDDEDTKMPATQIQDADAEMIYEKAKEAYGISSRSVKLPPSPSLHIRKTPTTEVDDSEAKKRASQPYGTKPGALHVSHDYSESEHSKFLEQVLEHSIKGAADPNAVAEKKSVKETTETTTLDVAPTDGLRRASRQQTISQPGAFPIHPSRRVEDTRRGSRRTSIFDFVRRRHSAVDSSSDFSMPPVVDRSGILGDTLIQATLVEGNSDEEKGITVEAEPTWSPSQRKKYGFVFVFCLVILFGLAIMLSSVISINTASSSDSAFSGDPSFLFPTVSPTARFVMGADDGGVDDDVVLEEWNSYYAVGFGRATTCTRLGPPPEPVEISCYEIQIVSLMGTSTCRYRARDTIACQANWNRPSEEQGGVLIQCTHEAPPNSTDFVHPEINVTVPEFTTSACLGEKGDGILGWGSSYATMFSLCSDPSSNQRSPLDCSHDLFQPDLSEEIVSFLDPTPINVTQETKYCTQTNTCRNNATLPCQVTMDSTIAATSVTGICDYNQSQAKEWWENDIIRFLKMERYPLLQQLHLEDHP